MAYDDAARVDSNTTGMENAGALRDTIRAAAKVFGEAVIVAMGTYLSDAKDKQWFRDQYVNMLRDLTHKMKDK